MNEIIIAAYSSYVYYTLLSQVNRVDSACSFLTSPPAVEEGYGRKSGTYMV